MLGIANSAHSFIRALFLHHTVIGKGARFFHDKKRPIWACLKGRYLKYRWIRTWCRDWRRLYPVFDAAVPPWIPRSQFFARWPHTDSGKCAPRGTSPKRKDLYFFFLLSQSDSSVFDPDSIAAMDPDPESQLPTMFWKEAWRILPKPGSLSCRST